MLWILYYNIIFIPKKQLKNTYSQWFCLTHILSEKQINPHPPHSVPFAVAPGLVFQPGRCDEAGGAAGQKCVLHALEDTGLWWARQPAAGWPCRRHWMERVWTPPPQVTEHWDREPEKTESDVWKEREEVERGRGREKEREAGGDVTTVASLQSAVRFVKVTVTKSDCTCCHGEEYQPRNTTLEPVFPGVTCGGPGHRPRLQPCWRATSGLAKFLHLRMGNSTYLSERTSHCHHTWGKNF